MEALTQTVGLIETRLAHQEDRVEEVRSPCERVWAGARMDTSNPLRRPAQIAARQREFMAGQ